MKILGIGTDLVKITRFSSWVDFSHERLLRVFSEQELIDCSKDQHLQSEKLASRFAAKEAFYKALSAALVKLGYINKTFPLLFACRYSHVVKSVWGVPILQVDWKTFEKKVGFKLPAIEVHLSLADEQDYVSSFVILVA